MRCRRLEFVGDMAAEGPRTCVAMYFMRLCSVLLLTGIVCACKPRDRGLKDAVVRKSEHFEYLAAPHDASVCDGLLDELEARFTALRQLLNFPWPAGKRLHYTKYPSVPSYRERTRCSSNNASCFKASFGVESPDALNAHELVHGLLSYLGDSHPLLEEGIAEALSCEGGWLADRAWVPLASIMRRELWSAEGDARRNAYAAAGRLVAMLLRQHPAQRFRDLYALAEPHASLEELSGLFRQFYGQPLERLWVSAEQSQERACLRTFECAAPALGSATRGCGDSPASKAGRHHSRISVETPSWVKWWSERNTVHLGACGQEGFGGHRVSWQRPRRGAGGESFFSRLPVGDFFVTFNAGGSDLRRGASLVLADKQAVSKRAADCGPLLESHTRRDVTFFVNGGVAERFRWRNQATQRPMRFVADCSGSVSARLCAGCGDAACEQICAPNAPLDERTVEVEPGGTLHWVIQGPGGLRLRRSYGRSR